MSTTDRINVLAGEGGGLRARADFSGQATASAHSSIVNQGAGSASAGAQGTTTFRGDSRLAGSVSNEAGGGAGFDGGPLDFRGRASHDTSGIDPSLGIVRIRNNGGTLAEGPKARPRSSIAPTPVRRASAALFSGGLLIGSWRLVRTRRRSAPIPAPHRQTARHSATPSLRGFASATRRP